MPVLHVDFVHLHTYLSLFVILRMLHRLIHAVFIVWHVVVCMVIAVNWLLIVLCTRRRFVFLSDLFLGRTLIWCDDMDFSRGLRFFEFRVVDHALFSFSQKISHHMIRVLHYSSLACRCAGRYHVWNHYLAVLPTATTPPTDHTLVLTLGFWKMYANHSPKSREWWQHRWSDWSPCDKWILFL